MPALAEEGKDATTTIASEALRVVPESDKQMAGLEIGGALTNLGSVLYDVTLWARILAGVPRHAIGLVLRVAQRWRETPAARRVLPTPKLLLGAAAGYSATAE